MWEEHVARMEEKRGVYRVLVGKPEGTIPLGRTGVDGRIILSGCSGSGMWGHGLDRAGSGCGQVAGTCECGNEHSGFIKCEEFLVQLTYIFSVRTPLCSINVVFVL